MTVPKRPETVEVAVMSPLYGRKAGKVLLGQTYFAIMSMRVFSVSKRDWLDFILRLLATSSLLPLDTSRLMKRTLMRYSFPTKSQGVVSSLTVRAYKSIVEWLDQKVPVVVIVNCKKEVTHGGDRTRDHAVKSRALYRLSYMDCSCFIIWKLE
eukprot:scaffold197_cov268-Chaetoceros_neogracile.AAC.30